MGCMGAKDPAGFRAAPLTRLRLRPSSSMYHLVTGQRRGRFGPRGGHGVTPSGERAWVARARRQGSPSALRDLDPLRLGHRPATIGCHPDQPSGAAMATVTDIHQLLDQHVVLDLECLDRIYLNAYVPTLQVGGQVVTFLTQHLGYPIPSPALFANIGDRFRDGVKTFARRHRIPLFHFKKGQRKIEAMRPYLHAAASRGVVAIGVAQEFQSVMAGYNRATRNPGAAHFGFHKADRRVTVFYFYIWDDEFGPGFIKLCSYFPYPAKVWLNGHEWAKRQAQAEDLAFTELANGFASCQDPARLQAICDRLGPSRSRPSLIAGWPSSPLRSALASASTATGGSSPCARSRPRAPWSSTPLGAVAPSSRPSSPTTSAWAGLTRCSSSSPARSARTPEACSPPSSSTAAPRWPSTSSTATPASRST